MQNLIFQKNYIHCEIVESSFTLYATALAAVTAALSLRTCYFTLFPFKYHSLCKAFKRLLPIITHKCNFYIILHNKGRDAVIIIIFLHRSHYLYIVQLSYLLRNEISNNNFKKPELEIVHYYGKGKHFL